MGEAAINPGTPLGKSRTVSADGLSEDDGDAPMNGYSIVRAAGMEAALEIASLSGA